MQILRNNFEFRPSVYLSVQLILVFGIAWFCSDKIIGHGDEAAYLFDGFLNLVSIEPSFIHATGLLYPLIISTFTLIDVLFSTLNFWIFEDQPTMLAFSKGVVDVLESLSSVKFLYIFLVLLITLMLRLKWSSWVALAIGGILFPDIRASYVSATPYLLAWILGLAALERASDASILGIDSDSKSIRQIIFPLSLLAIASSIRIESIILVPLVIGFLKVGSRSDRFKWMVGFSVVFILLTPQLITDSLQVSIVLGGYLFKHGGLEVFASLVFLATLVMVACVSLNDLLNRVLGVSTLLCLSFAATVEFVPVRWVAPAILCLACLCFRFTIEKKYGLKTSFISTVFLFVLAVFSYTAKPSSLAPGALNIVESQRIPNIMSDYLDCLAKNKYRRDQLMSHVSPLIAELMAQETNIEVKQFARLRWLLISDNLGLRNFTDPSNSRSLPELSSGTHRACRFAAMQNGHSKE